MTHQPIRHPVRILGIDPGLRRTGLGVIEIDGNRLISSVAARWNRRKACRWRAACCYS